MVDDLVAKAVTEPAVIDNHAADYADLTQSKQAKFAEEAHRRTSHNHNEGGADIDKTDTRSTIIQALDNSKWSFVKGGAIFAGFATLLSITTWAAGLVMGMDASLALTATEKLVGLVGATLTGSLWLGGNETIRQYNKIEDEKAAHEKQRSEGKGVAIAQNQAQEQGKDRAVTFDAPVHGAAVVASVPAVVAFKHTQEPVQERPAWMQAILDRGSRANLSPKELAALTAEERAMNEQAV